ncbi:recombination-associated protein RdgC [Xanthomonadaceae bacterium XH05]|nr:recombination-associated protein RdgC [Xanthomonadaceae bacterium XH05]
MLFRNLTLFRFPLSLLNALESIEDKLPEHALKALASLELSTRGFVSPFGRGHETLAHRVGDCVLLNLGGEDKILPASVINEVLANKLDLIREQEGRSPGGRERKRLKDEVLTDLLPRAFSKPTRTPAYLDLSLGWLVVDTSSRKNAETLVSAIREVLGSFPALPVNAESSPRALLTGWLGGEPLPEGFSLGDECELRDPVDSGAIVKCRRQELDADEVREHLKVGKQCFQLGLIFADRLSFVLGEDMVIRKLKFLETATESLEKDDRQSVEAEVDATFALMSGELRLLLERLETEFALSKAEA